jgi:preprotein translocase subunit SecG
METTIVLGVGMFVIVLIIGYIKKIKPSREARKKREDENK